MWTYLVMEYYARSKPSNQLTSQILKFVEMLVNSGIPSDEVDLAWK